MEAVIVLVMGIHILINGLLLVAAGKLAGKRICKKGVFYGALLAGVYAGACLMPGLGAVSGGLGRVVCFAVVGFLAYGRDFLFQGVLYFMLSMALEGLAGGSAWAVVLIASGLCYLYLGGYWGGDRTGGTYVPVTIFYGGQKLKLTALHDTGNSLKDPMTGASVLVVQADAAEKLIGLDVEQLKDPMNTILTAKVPGLRLIPYHAIGTPRGMLLAIQPEKVLLGDRQTKLLVAFAPQRIDQANRFQALAGGSL